MTAKKGTKKRDARAKILVLLIKPIAFLKFSLPSPSSDLKVPILVKTRSRMTTAITFSRQKDAGSRVSNTQY